MPLAIRYALSRWRALTRYLDDGRIEMDNSAAERALRTVALGRNYVQFPIMRSAQMRRPVAPLRVGVCEISHCA